jgi:hypothetical protein
VVPTRISAETKGLSSFVREIGVSIFDACRAALTLIATLNQIVLFPGLLVTRQRASSSRALAAAPSSVFAQKRRSFAMRPVGARATGPFAATFFLATLVALERDGMRLEEL